MNKRRSLTPPGTASPASQGGHALRRGGARQTVSERVTFHGPAGVTHEGWALNISRGGLRAILDSEDDGPKVELGEEYEVVVGDPEAPGCMTRHGRIVWLQEEPDGFVVGIEYVGLSGTRPSAAPAAPESATKAVDGGRSPGGDSEPPKS